MPEIADRLRRVDSAPRFYRIRAGTPGDPHYDVLLPWDELCDFVELAEQLQPDGVSPHEWAVRKGALASALRVIA